MATLGALPLASEATAKAPEPPRLAADAWIVLDPEDDAVLAARRARAELPMASTTKLMTAYLARRALDPDEVVTAAPYSPGPAESLMRLRRGERVAVRDLLYGLLLASGNDAAVTLATAAGGSEDAFVGRMNRAARRLGLEQTSYENPIGFDGLGHHTSARDLVDLAVRLRRDRLLRRIVATDRITLDGGERRRRLVNRNDLVGSVPWVDGVKTGFTEGAGYVLVGSGVRKGVTLVSAVLGTTSEAARDAATLRLLDYGFSLYRREPVLGRGERVAETAIRYRDETVPLAATRALELTLRRDQEVEVQPRGVEAEVEGPVERGERLGAAVVTVDGGVEARVHLRATRSAEAATLIERIDSALPGDRVGAWGLLALGLLVLLLITVPGSIWLWRRRSSR